MSLGLTKVGYSDGHGDGMNVPKIEVTTVLEGLKNPWDMAWTADGSAMFFTEKLDGLSVLVDGKSPQTFRYERFIWLCSDSK